MKVGLIDVDGHNFPNLALMKISAYHKSRGDQVEFAFPMYRYDKVYVSKIFGDEYSKMPPLYIQADEIVCGGTGFAITVENGKEVYHKCNDKPLPPEIEHMYPDYTLYPNLTKDTAYGFLTRGCPNNCGFCIVSQKECARSVKVADLSEFWRGQRHIKLLDPNLLACKDRADLLRQLINSRARVDFTQGLDARFVTEAVAGTLKKIKNDKKAFVFGFMKKEKGVVKGFDKYKRVWGAEEKNEKMYYDGAGDTTIEEDLYRLQRIKQCGFLPDVRIYRKPAAPQILRDLQRWCNNRILYRSCDFMDYVPRADGKTIKQLYFGG